MAKNSYRYFNYYYWIRKFTFTTFFQNLFFLSKGYKRRIVFKSILKSFHWRDYNKPKHNESLSGLGSDLDTCEKLLTSLHSFVDKHKINTILDLACGDFNWVRKLIELHTNIQVYCGLEIVDEIVKKNIISYSNEKIEFVNCDVVQDDLPNNFDLVIIKDFFIHISNKDINEVIFKVKKSNAKYMAINTLSTVEKNIDLLSYGHHRDINIEKAPFNLSNPYLRLKDFNREVNIYDLRMINEKS